MNDKERVSAGYAKESLINALLEMLRETPLSAITISELTKRAGVSRMTFYRNYTSTEDILIKRLREIMEKYWYEDDADLEKDRYYDVKYLEHCFRYFYENKFFLESLIAAGYGDLFVEALTDYLNRKWKIGDSAEEKFYVIAFTGILYNIFKNCSKDGYKVPVKEMAEKVESLCNYGIKHKSMEL